MNSLSHGSKKYVFDVKDLLPVLERLQMDSIRCRRGLKIRIGSLVLGTRKDLCRMPCALGSSSAGRVTVREIYMAYLSAAEILARFSRVPFLSVDCDNLKIGGVRFPIENRVRADGSTTCR